MTPNIIRHSLVIQIAFISIRFKNIIKVFVLKYHQYVRHGGYVDCFDKPNV